MKPACINLIFTIRFYLLRVAQIQFVLWSRGAVFIDTLHYEMPQTRTTILLASISYIIYLRTIAISAALTAIQETHITSVAGSDICAGKHESLVIRMWEIDTRGNTHHYMTSVDNQFNDTTYVATLYFKQSN